MYNKYLIQESTLSNIINNIKKIIDIHSSINILDCMSLLSQSTYTFSPLLALYNDGEWPMISGQIYDNESISNYPLLFYDYNSDTATDLGKLLTQACINNVSEIQQNAFRSCSNLTYISINNTQIIKPNAFRDCINLTSGFFNCEIFSQGIFRNCINLTDIECITNEIGTDCFYGCESLSHINITARSNSSSTNLTFKWKAMESLPISELSVTNGEQINEIFLESHAFQNCINLKTFNLFNYISQLTNNNIFESCGFEIIEAPNLVTISGNSIFKNCTSLHTVIFPELTTLSGEEIFLSTQITELNFPNLTLLSGGRFAMSTLTTINFPLISEGAEQQFAFCCNLSNITLASNFILNNYMFADCSALSDITSFINNTTIPLGCFERCGIQSANFPLVDIVSDYGFYTCQSLSTINFSNANIIGRFGFAYCKELESVNLPNVTSIGNYAFKGCTKLKTINLPLLTYLEYNSEYDNGFGHFTNCESLEEINLPLYSGSNLDLTTCSNLKNINLPLVSNLSLFSNLKNVNNIIIDYTNITTVPENLFMSNSILTTMNLPNCSSVQDKAFYTCTNLSQIILSTSQTNIGTSAFTGCTNLTEVQGSFYEIHSYAFKDCNNLSSINLYLCDEIGESAFQNCSSLTSIDIRYARTVKEYAFANCINLQSVGGAIRGIGDYAFYNCYNLSGTISLESYYYTLGTGAFKNCSKIESVNLPAVQYLGNGAFIGCENLTSFSAPNVEYLGDSDYLGGDVTMFTNCQMTTLSFPKCVSIWGGLCNNCQKLTQVTLNSSSVTRLNQEAYYVFQNCPNLKKIIVGTTAMVSKYKQNEYWKPFSAYIVSK